MLVEKREKSFDQIDRSGALSPKEWHDLNCRFCPVHAWVHFYNLSDDDADHEPLIGRVDKAEKMSKKILECGASHGSSLG